MGDGVAEWTKVSVATRTDAGSNSAAGGIFLLAVMVSGERGRHPPGNGRYLYGLPLKNSAKTNTHVGICHARVVDDGPWVAI